MRKSLTGTSDKGMRRGKVESSKRRNQVQNHKLFDYFMGKMCGLECVQMEVEKPGDG